MCSLINILLRQKCQWIQQPIFLSRNYSSLSKCNVASRNTSSLSNPKPKYEVSSEIKPIGEKIKENTKTASYVGIIMLGLGVTGVMFYAIFKELFSPKSPNAVYGKTLEKVKIDSRVQDALGVPIKGYGEETRRRRRNHVAHSVYQKNGFEHMRMQFYVQGLRQKATVHLEMKENSTGDYEYRYLFVQLDQYPKTTIILEDNRGLDQIYSKNENIKINRKVTR